MKAFIVVTPTFNRAKFLVRLYESLLTQTLSYDSFDWLIVDDGSTDNTQEVLQGLMETSPFEIIYKRKENGGKHTAWRYAVDCLSDSKDYRYFVSIDSDDVLTNDALSVFLQHWNDIEQNSPDVGILNARTILYGGVDKPHHIYGSNEYIEDTYQNVAIKMGEQSEMITSFRVKDLNNYLNIPNKFWLSNYVKFFSENILWGRNGRKTKTRWLKKYLRIVYCDSGNQVSNNAHKKGVRHLYNYIVGYKYYLTENIDYIIKYQRISLLIDLIKYGAMCIIVGIPISESYNELNIRLLKVLYAMSLPFSLFVAFAFKLRRIVR